MTCLHTLKRGNSEFYRKFVKIACPTSLVEFLNFVSGRSHRHAQLNIDKLFIAIIDVATLIIYAFIIDA